MPGLIVNALRQHNPHDTCTSWRWLSVASFHRELLGARLRERGEREALDRSAQQKMFPRSGQMPLIDRASGCAPASIVSGGAGGCGRSGL